jgi:uncharacterized membrane protein
MRLLRGGLAFVGLLPWLRSFGGAILPGAAREAIEWTFAPLCHHLPERTLWIGGAPMCVCSRCAGLYAGLVIAALWPRSYDRNCGKACGRLFSIGVALALIDILSQDLGLHPPSNPVRWATGAWVGVALGAWMLSEMAARPTGRAS